MKTGLLLFSQFSKNTRFAALIKLNPAKYRPLLIEKLCAIAGIEQPEHSSTTIPRRKFREDFPFLRNPDCPVELKILAADKITAHERYVQAHDELFDCTSLNECHQTAREAIENFMENRAIFAELDYYREHHAILGKHRIFDHLRQLRDMQKLNIVELISKRRCLESAIWRINNEIKKGTKPHLLTEREQRRRQKETLLAEVEKRIATYEHDISSK